MSRLLSNAAGLQAWCRNSPGCITPLIKPPGFIKHQVLVNRPRYVITTAKSRSASAGGTSQPEGPDGSSSVEYADLISSLEELPYAELQKRLRAVQIPAVGKKLELVERLAKAMIASGEVQSTAPAPKAPVPAPKDETEELDSATLRAELDLMSQEELVGTLSSFGLDTQGTKSVLVERLAQLMEEDMRREAQEAIDKAAAETTAFTQHEKDTLLAARVAKQVDELQTMARQTLYHELKAAAAPGTPVLYLGRDELAEELAGIRARVALNKQLANPQEHAALRAELAALPPEEESPARAAAAPGAVTGALNCGIALTDANADPAVILSLSITQLKKLKIDEVKVALKALGQGSMEGNRYKLMEQLQQTVAQQQQGGVGEEGEEMSATVSGMPLRTLRTELMARGIDSRGSRATLESRLKKALVDEQKIQDIADEEERIYLEQLQQHSPLGALIDDDPALTVALLFGAPGGTLDDLQSSLDAALAAASTMHTAWPSASAVPSLDEPHLEGVSVRLLYVKPDMSIVEYPVAALQGCTAADVLAGAPSLSAAALGLDSSKQYADGVALAAALTAEDPEVPATILSAVCTAGMSLAQQQQLAGVLEGAAQHVPVIGSASSGDKLRFSQVLKDAGFPVLPRYSLQMSDLQSMAKWRQGLEAWADKQGHHPANQAYIIKPSTGRNGVGVTPATGVEDASITAAALLVELYNAAGGEPGDLAVLVEPNMSEVAMHVSVTVIDSPDGPIALLPTEIEITDIDIEILNSEMQYKERQLMQEGYTADQIEELLAEIRTETHLVDPRYTAYSYRRPSKYTQTVKYHHPPRLPYKLIQALRHSAALAYLKMGLKGGARIDGWVDMDAGWKDKYDRPDDGSTRVLPDIDPSIVERMKAEALKEDTLAGPPITEYYDTSLNIADLSRFNPRTRLFASHNQEGTIYFTDCNPGLELDPGAPVFLQAAELGLSHLAVLRNLVNSAFYSRTPAAAPAQPPAPAAAGKKGKRSSKSATPDPAPASLPATSSASTDSVYLEPPPPVDPYETAPLFHERPDLFDILHGVTEWREKQWLKQHQDDLAEEIQVTEALNVAELLEEALQGGTELPRQADGELDLNRLPYAYADTWGVDIKSEPYAEVAPTVELPAVGETITVSPLEVASAKQMILEDLREHFAGLPEEDLMWVVMGRGPDGRRIDLVALKELLAQYRAQGTFVAIDALEQCLVDEDTGVMGEPVQESFGPENEPGGYLAATVPVPMQEAVAHMQNEASYANSRLMDPKRVWLLVGGDAENTTNSLTAARHVMMHLSQCLDVQVEVFLITPGVMPSNEETARKELLARRVEWRATGVTEADLTPYMDLEYLRYPPPPTVPMHKALVWALTPAQVLQHTAESANWAAESALHLATTSYWSLPTLEQQQRDAHHEVQLELEAAGVDGVAGLWGGEATAPKPPPRLLNMREMASQAQDVNAVIMPMMRGTDLSHWVKYFHDKGVLYTGSAPVAAAQCVDKLRCVRAIQSIQTLDGSMQDWTIPSQMLAGGAVAEAGNEYNFAAALMETLRGVLYPDYEAPAEEDVHTLGPSAHPLCIRPSDGADGVGVARLDTPDDLMQYGFGLLYGMQQLPANTLTLPHRPIVLPRMLPQMFVFQPWIQTDHLTISPPAAGSADATPSVAITPGTGWVECSMSFLGTVGTMEPMGISVLSQLDGNVPGAAPVDDTARRVRSMVAAAQQAQIDAQQQVLDQPDDAPTAAPEQAASSETAAPVKAGRKSRSKSKSAGSDTPTAAAAASQPDAADQASSDPTAPPTAIDPLHIHHPPAPVYITPPPAHILSEQVVTLALNRARVLLDQLGASGLVKIDAFVSRETGELALIEVDLHPSLAQGSIVYQQALHRPAGALTPTNLLRAMIDCALLDDKGVQSADLDAVQQELVELGSDLEGDEDEAIDLDQLNEFDDGSVITGGDDMLEDLAEAQDAAPAGVTSEMLGPNDSNELYLSSTGRAARRGKAPSAAQRFGDGPMGDDDDTGGYIMGDDFDIDGQGQGPDDADYQDNWSIRNM